MDTPTTKLIDVRITIKYHCLQQHIVQFIGELGTCDYQQYCNPRLFPRGFFFFSEGEPAVHN